MKKLLSAILLISLAQITNAQVLGGGLTGSGTRMLQVNSSGELTPLAPGTSSQVLFGNSAWGDLPWSSSGGNITFTTGVTAPSFSTTGSISGGATTVSSFTNSGNTTLSGNLNIAGTTTLSSVAVTGTLTANQLNSTDNLSAPHILASRFLSLDSMMRFGDSAVLWPANGVTVTNPFNGQPRTFDNIYSDKDIMALGRNSIAGATNAFVIGTNPSNPTKAYGANSIAIGQAGTETDGTGSMALGFNVKTTQAANNSIVLGSGFGTTSSGTLLNSTAHSLVVGFNSNVATLFVGGGNGTANSTGNVGIANSSPLFPLDVTGVVNSSSFFRSGTSTNYLLMGFDGSNKVIEAVGSPGLLVNYGSGTNIGLCTGTNGGFVTTGANLQIGSVIQNLNAATALNVACNNPQNTAINVDANGNNVFKVANNGSTIVGYNSHSTSTYTSQKFLVVNGDISLANYSVSGSNGTDGFNGIEILGGNKVPTRRGISTDDDPYGDFNFYVNSYQSPSGSPAEFNFKSGIDPNTGNPAVDAAHAPTLMKLDFTGALTLPTLSVTTAGYRNVLIDNDGKIVPGGSVASAGSAWVLGGNGTTTSSVPLSFGTTDTVDIPFITNNTQRMLLTKDGKLHIGGHWQKTGQHADALFSVDGKAIAKSFYVTNNNWADFVFDSNYKLMSLSEVEKYYKENHHLPNVPSEKEIKEKGNNVGETEAILLEKVEELTLYLVQQQKEIDALKKQNNLLSEKVNGKK